jgi:predicted nucleotidyltransferase
MFSTSKSQFDLNDYLSKVVRSVLGSFPWNIKAIVVFGSMASGENLKEARDVDLYVIEHVYDPFLELRVKKALKNPPVNVGICHHPLWHFNRLRTILAFDVRNAGQVIYGDRGILKKTNPKHIHKYEAVKVFFNYGIVKLNSCISKKVLEAKKISEEQAGDIVYGSMKAFEGICTALLILRNKYKLGYKARANLLSKIYRRDYPILYSQMPELPDQITFATELRLGHRKFEGDYKQLWFRTKKYVEHVLPFVIHEYFRKNKSTRIAGILELDELPRSITTSLLYAYRLFIRYRKIAPIKSMLVQPVAKVHIANAYVLLAVNSSLNFDRKLLQLAEDNIKTVYPMVLQKEVSPIQRWEEIRRICVALNEEGIVSQPDLHGSENWQDTNLTR